jgi:hypothetical protein
MPGVVVTLLVGAATLVGVLEDAQCNPKRVGPSGSCLRSRRRAGYRSQRPARTRRRCPRSGRSSSEAVSVPCGRRRLRRAPAGLADGAAGSEPLDHRRAACPIDSPDADSLAPDRLGNPTGRSPFHTHRPSWTIQVGARSICEHRDLAVLFRQQPEWAASRPRRRSPDARRAGLGEQSAGVSAGV